MTMRQDKILFLKSQSEANTIEPLFPAQKEKKNKQNVNKQQSNQTNKEVLYGASMYESF